jgi:hypothetical protein
VIDMAADEQLLGGPALQVELVPAFRTFHSFQIFIRRLGATPGMDESVCQSDTQ